MSVKRDIRFRVYISFTCMVLLGFAIIFKAISIQANEGTALRAKARKAHIRTQPMPAQRGNIYAEDGTLLSSTIPQFDLRIDFSVINKDTFYHYVDSLSEGLSMVFKDASSNQYRSRLKAAFKQGQRYWRLHNDVPYYQYQIIRQLPIFNKGQNRGGFIAESNSKRVDPYGMLAYRTLGLWRENAPGIGLEKEYDKVLSGTPGTRIIRKTTGGVWIPIEGSEVDPVNGKDIVTTIDINIQDVTEHALMNILEKYECQYGTAIVMEVKTGKIRALANLGRQDDGSYWEDFNYALLPSEPGSTFKLFSLLALIDDGYVTLDSTVNVHGGRVRFGNYTIVDDHSGLGIITVKKALELSSNVAFAWMVNHYYKDHPMKFIRHLRALKLDQKTGIDLPGERKPYLQDPNSDRWNKHTSLPWIGYGYGSLITPLHTCMVYNAVANNGKMMRPYLVSAIKEYGQVVKKINPKVVVPSIAKPSTIQQLQEALEGVVAEGTARGIRSPYYKAAGKTGTAQVAGKGFSYAAGIRQGSFVGYFPADHPEYTITVLARSKPHGAYYGAVLGAPVFKAIADKLYASKIGGWSVPVDSVDHQKDLAAVKAPATHFDAVFQRLGWHSVTGSSTGIVSLQPRGNRNYQRILEKSDYQTVPNVTGMGLKDAVYLLETRGLKVTIAGSGKVKEQSLAAGSKIVKGSHIHLSLG